MKISSIRCYLLSCPLPDTRRGKRDAMVVRVSAGKLTGFGPGPASEDSARAISQWIAPFLEGRELGDPDALRVQFQEGPGRDLALFRLYCAVEIALFDLLGKAEKTPASEFLGGRVRDRIRVYAAGGVHGAPEHFAEEAYKVSRQDFRAYKMEAGLGPERDAQTAELIRRSAGSGFDLMVGAAQWRNRLTQYSSPVVGKLMAELGSLGVTWIDEPLPPDDHDAYRQLRERDLAPIAAGQSEPDDFRILDLIFNQGVDYVQMNLTAQAGYWAARRILPEVAHAGLRFSFHGCSNLLEVAAAAQLGVCWPEMVAEWLEYPVESLAFPPGGEMLKDPLEIKDGNLIAPRGPGLGINFNERVLERYPWAPGAVGA